MDSFICIKLANIFYTLVWLILKIYLFTFQNSLIILSYFRKYKCVAGALFRICPKQISFHCSALSISTKILISNVSLSYISTTIKQILHTLKIQIYNYLINGFIAFLFLPATELTVRWLSRFRIIPFAASIDFKAFDDKR